MNGNEFDVIVVGGGPAGSACATVVARQGYRVAVLERARFPREKICGDTLNPRAWPLLEELGPELPPLPPVTALRVFSSRGRRAHTPLRAGSDRPMVAVRRSVLDTALLRNAARAGASVFEETTAGSIEAGRRISLRARGPEGPWMASCRYLVGADGRNSTVARALGKRARQPKDGRIGLQWYAPFQEDLGREIHLYLLPFGYFGIVNVDGSGANLAMVLDTRRSGSTGASIPLLIETMRRANRLIDRSLGDLRPISEVQHASPVTPWRHARGDGRILLVGDAAGIVEPFTGEGMYFALRAGMAAGSSLCRRLAGAHHARLGRRGGFWANRVISPALRHMPLADAAVALGDFAPRLTRLASRLVARV